MTRDTDYEIDRDRDMETPVSMSRHDLYETWRNMVRRCHKATFPDYYKYGAKGVTVCQRWRDDFWAFAQDVGARPDPSYSLDRLESTGNYEPGNIKWSTTQEQNRNKTNNRWFTADGITLLAGDWADKLRISRTTFYRRIARGITIEEMLWTK